MNNISKFKFHTLFTAALITFFSYLLNMIKVSDVSDLFGLITTGLPLLKGEIFKSSFYASLPFMPIVIAWVIIGMVGYLNYYSLNLVYCNVYNYLILKYKYTHPQSEDELELKRQSRLAIHSLVILAYTSLYVLVFTVLLPLGELMRVFIYSNVPFFSIDSTDSYFSYFCLFLYWIIGFGILNIVFDNFRAQLSTEELFDEHYSLK